jgi:NADH-quinone oxidoreductase subunit N
MNASYLILEIVVALIGLAVLLADLWTPREAKRNLGYVAAAAVAGVLFGSFFIHIDPADNLRAFSGMFALDALALCFKRFFLLAGVIVLLMSVEFAERFESGVAEFYALVLFALAGMLFAASANDFIMVFVALELITVTFYILTSFQRGKAAALEAGVKYLILGALASSFLVFGVAFVFGASNTTNFDELATAKKAVLEGPVFRFGLVMILVGLGFKIAAFPFQVWAPDVYEGAPAPTTAFLAVGSKAAGIALLLRVLFVAAPEVAFEWTRVLMAISAVTILYGNLCAIPQRNLKRLLGYSSIANAGYMLMGFAVCDQAGASAVLYYLGGYLFTVLAAFTVISVITRKGESEDVGALAGLGQRSPLLAAALAFSMISLAGIPPLAGFFGKFLILKTVFQHGLIRPSYLVLFGVAVVGVAISIYYYFGLVRSMYWAKEPADLSPIEVSLPTRLSLGFCMLCMLYFGVFPQSLLNATDAAAKVLKL